MADPTKYTRQFDYSDNTLADMRSNLNPEFSTIVVSIDEIVEAIKDIRRSDGALNNEIVTEDSLHPTLKAKLVFNDGPGTYLIYDDGVEVDDGGNPRGLHAVDLQATRANATEVASGDYSAILAGRGNTAAGIESAVVAGDGNVASGVESVVLGGSSNTASGRRAIAGGSSSTASGDRSFAFGGLATAQGDESVAIGLGAVVATGATNGVAMGRSAGVNHTGAMVLADGVDGIKVSRVANQLSLYFANGAQLNDNDLLDTSDLNANGGTIVEASQLPALLSDHLTDSDLVANGGTIVQSADLGAAATSNDHVDLANVGTNTHAQIDSHIADADKHRTINDPGSAVTDLWSAQRIISKVDVAYANWLVASDQAMFSGNAAITITRDSYSTRAKNVTSDSIGFLTLARVPMLLTGTIIVENMDATARIEILEDGVGLFEVPVSGTGNVPISAVVICPNSVTGHLLVRVAKSGGDGTIKAGTHIAVARAPGEQ